MRSDSQVLAAPALKARVPARRRRHFEWMMARWRLFVDIFEFGTVPEVLAAKAVAATAAVPQPLAVKNIS
jgi:hypothetical protein